MSHLVRTPLLAVAALWATGASAGPGYLRQPDVHHDQIVFCAENDLWLVGDGGGRARRLTRDAGTESFPRFSPDGSRIAFTGEYDGNRDVYVIDAEGGEPRRMTWHPAGDQVIGWSPDGEQILFRSGRDHPLGSSQVYALPAGGGDATVLPLGWAARLDIDPDSGRWAFNRKSWENATWKRYRGGTATDLWVGHPDRQDYRRITEFEGNDAYPMWHDGRIWFSSDRGGTYNLWSIAPDGSDARQHTRFDAWDVRWPAAGPDGRFVFTVAADLHLLDAADGSVRKIDVDLPSDRPWTRVRYGSPESTLSWFELSPSADRLLVVTRGEMFSVPVEDGVTLPITRGSGARERWGHYSPDGETVYYVSDAEGEEEIRSSDAWGRGEAKIVRPAGARGWHFPPTPSPDGKWLAYADETQTLFVIPTEGGEPRRVDRSPQSEISSYVWSPDGRWLAYARSHTTDYASIHLYDVTTGETHAATGPTTHDFSPAWDPEGRYLYFLSSRSTNPILGGRDWQNVEARNTRPYMLLLRADLDHPFAGLAGLPPKEEDEPEAAADATEATDGAAADESTAASNDEEAPKPVEIDLDGLASRIVELPVPRGAYYGLQATASTVFYMEAPIRGMAEMPGLFQSDGPTSSLIAFTLASRSAAPFQAGVSAYALAPGASKIAFMKQPGEIYVVGTEAPPGPDLSEARVSLADVVIELDPREEWRQIFHEGWRHMRDFYWDRGMAGVDWDAERERYASLLPRVASRADLSDLIGELIGELATSHTYVFGGDRATRPDSVAIGFLGADFAREGDAYRVAHVYRADPADNVRSPLDAPGVGVREGDYVLAINHQPFPSDRPLLASLAGYAGKEILLTVNDHPTAAGARDVVVRTMPSERDLRYSEWVRRNREYVHDRTDGKIGYLHLPDMWTGGLVEFNTWFYPQLDREGLVVDVRWNGGGAVSQMIVERLRRRPISFNRSRGGGVNSYPYRTLNGPFVVLTNEFAGSDGDIFPTAIQLEELAPVIGMRSWGGVVGIRGDKALVDGGLLTQPEYAWWDTERGWELENRGVEPDIEVQNLPQELARGVDSQLDRGIDEVLRLHHERPPVSPEFGPVRDRSRGAFAAELESQP